MATCFVWPMVSLLLARFGDKEGSLIQLPQNAMRLFPRSKEQCALFQGCWTLAKNESAPGVADAYLQSPNIDKPCSEYITGFKTPWTRWKWAPLSKVRATVDKYSTGNLMLLLGDAASDNMTTPYCTQTTRNQSMCSKDALVPFNTYDASQCLAGSRLQFVGDSLSRQQMLSLQAMLYTSMPTVNGQLKGNDGSVVRSLPSHRYYHRPFKDTPNRVRLSLLNGAVAPVTLDWNHRNWWVDVSTANYEQTKKFMIEPRSCIQLTNSLKNADTTVLIMNMGHWWGDVVEFPYDFKKGCKCTTSTKCNYSQHALNLPVRLTNEQVLLCAFREAVKTTVKALNHTHGGPIVWRTMAASQYINGTWKRGTCKLDRPAYVQPADNDLTALFNAILDEEIRPYMTLHFKPGRPYHIMLDVAELSDLRPDAKPSDRLPAPIDCTHWCLPGIPDLWNVFMLHQLCQRDYLLSY